MSDTIGTTAAPLAVNLSGDAKHAQMLYRLDAIARYIEQTAVIAEAKLEELYDEARVHIANLRHAKVLGAEQAQAFADRIGVK